MLASSIFNGHRNDQRNDQTAVESARVYVSLSHKEQDVSVSQAEFPGAPEMKQVLAVHVQVPSIRQVDKQRPDS
jgi:hypothetical protein